MADVAEGVAAVERGGLDRWRVVPLAAPLYLVTGVHRIGKARRYDKTPEQIAAMIERQCGGFAGTAERVYAMCVDSLGEADPTLVTAGGAWPAEHRGCITGETPEQAERSAVGMFREINA